MITAWKRKRSVNGMVLVKILLLILTFTLEAYSVNLPVNKELEAKKCYLNLNKKVIETKFIMSFDSSGKWSGENTYFDGYLYKNGKGKRIFREEMGPVYIPQTQTVIKNKANGVVYLLVRSSGQRVCQQIFMITEKRVKIIFEEMSSNFLYEESFDIDADGNGEVLIYKKNDEGIFVDIYKIYNDSVKCIEKNRSVEYLNLR